MFILISKALKMKNRLYFPDSGNVQNFFCIFLSFYLCIFVSLPNEEPNCVSSNMRRKLKNTHRVPFNVSHLRMRTKKRKQVFKGKKKHLNFLSPEATTYASPIVST